MSKRIFGIIILCIGLFLIGLFLYDILIDGTPLRESMPFRMVIFVLAFIYFGWKWLRGDRLKETGLGQKRLLPIGLDFASTVQLNRFTNLLLIDSDSDFQNALQTLCRINGKFLTVASSATEGISLAEKDIFDLVILSVELPDQRGFSVCSHLKKKPKLRKIPIIMVSHSASDNTFALHKKIGVTADAYYTKSDALLSLSRAS